MRTQIELSPKISMMIDSLTKDQTINILDHFDECSTDYDMMIIGIRVILAIQEDECNDKEMHEIFCRIIEHKDKNKWKH